MVRWGSDDCRTALYRRLVGSGGIVNGQQNEAAEEYGDRTKRKAGAGLFVSVS
jgi:hypothetical protein